MVPAYRQQGWRLPGSMPQLEKGVRHGFLSIKDPYFLHAVVGRLKPLEGVGPRACALGPKGGGVWLFSLFFSPSPLNKKSIAEIRAYWVEPKLFRSTTLDIITRLLDNAALVSVPVVGRFSKDFSEVRGLRSRGFQLQVDWMTKVLCSEVWKEVWNIFEREFGLSQLKHKTNAFVNLMKMWNCHLRIWWKIWHLIQRRYYCPNV